MEFIIAVLLWVDEVVSTVEGKENQENILRKMDEFAKKHKLRWGQKKCKILKIGKHHITRKTKTQQHNSNTRNTEEWKIGELSIGRTSRKRGICVPRMGRKIFSPLMGRVLFFDSSVFEKHSRKKWIQNLFCFLKYSPE